jgi:hypothetical protein
VKTKLLTLIAPLLAAALIACDAQNAETAQSRTQSSAVDTSAEKYVTLSVGEHKDIELPIAVDPIYAVSAATTSIAGSEVNLTNSQNVRYEIANIAAAARPVLRLVGAYAGKEAISVQAVDRGTGRVATLRVIVTVSPPSGNSDIIGGKPCDDDDCGGGGGGGGGGGDDDDGDDDIGDHPIQDPDACTTANGFYYVDDSYQDVEGKFGADFAAYIRSLTSGNVDSNIRLYYPGVTRTVELAYANLGRFTANLPSDPPLVIEFDLQLATFLFGLTKKYFYIETNDYCLRGNIPSSFMSPPDKKLTWVTQ